MRRSIIILSSFILFAFSACKEAAIVLTYEQQMEIDRGLIHAYLTENNIDVIEHESGIFYTINREGTGIFPSSFSSVKCNYKGSLLGETAFFDTGVNSGFSLSGVIKGWQIGIPLVAEGGSITLYIPSRLAYGTRGSPGGIPGNANLVFKVDLLDVLN